MTYTVNVSENLTYCFSEEALRDIAEEVYRNRSDIGQDTVTIKTRCGFVKADRDDMYNITIYGKGEEPIYSYVSQTILKVTDDGREYVKLDMPKGMNGEVEYGGETYALKQQAYPVDMSDQYTASAVRLSDGKPFAVYWDIRDGWRPEDYNDEEEACDWDNPVRVEEI